MDDLVMDTGYKFKTAKETHLFLEKVYDLDVEGVNFFIDDQKEPCGIVVIRFRGHADVSGLDKTATTYSGERTYLPADWRIQYSDYEMISIESVE